MIHRLFGLIIMLAALIASPAMMSPAGAQEFPDLTGRVVDQAGILSPADEEQLEQKLAGLETQSQRQLVVTTISDLQGYDIADFGYQLGRSWGIGDAERNDGALLIVAPNERKVRIEVGYGLEGILTDAYSSRIISSEIIPHFRDDDYPAGIIAGTDAIVTHLALPDDQALQLVAQSKVGSGAPMWVLPALFMMPGFVIFITLMAMKATGPKRIRWTGTTAGGTSVSSYSSSSSSWSSSSSSSSSFSGGGGSFGGGGSSGSW
ncbi:TPM domain-containing protein [Qipengyuania sp. DGS5-3]|uniref:TPM domain-containing protein n=1 Tax=Qipengyuania sp. DGS5-3 TaxID=3349632 RepID=UPI0036D2E65D